MICGTSSAAEWRTRSTLLRVWMTALLRRGCRWKNGRTWRNTLALIATSSSFEDHDNANADESPVDRIPTSGPKMSGGKYVVTPPRR